MRQIYIYLFIFFSVPVFSQNCEYDKESIIILKKDVNFLSSDKMEGRETGTIGEILALQYLKKRLDSIGVSYIVQNFHFNGIVK